MLQTPAIDPLKNYNKAKRYFKYGMLSIVAMILLTQLDKITHHYYSGYKISVFFAALLILTPFFLLLYYTFVGGYFLLKSFFKEKPVRSKVIYLFGYGLFLSLFLALISDIIKYLL